MYNRKEATKKLHYGSLEKVLDAFDRGAGLFFREDVAILINEIKKLKEQ